MRRGHDDEARRILGEVLAAFPDEPDALQLSGMLLRKANDQLAAVTLFERSLALRPAQPHVEHSLGNALLALGRRDDAAAAYSRAIALAPAHIDAKVALGECRFEGGAVAEGCAILEDATRQAPGHGRAWTSLGRAYRAAGRYDAAVEALFRGASLRPGHATTLYTLAVALRLAGRAEEAAEILREVIAAQPSLFEAHYVLGHCLQDLTRYDEAATAYRIALAIRPDARDAHDSLSRMLWQQQPGEDWLASYMLALEANPDDALLLADFAGKLGLAGEVDKAIALLEAAPEQAAASPEVAYRLGQLIAARKDGSLDQAVAPLTRAARASAVDHDARYELIRVLIALGRFPGAEEELLPLLRDRPDDQQALAFRGLLWRMQGDARACEIEDVDRFVSARTLTPPAGFGDIVSFNRALAALLDTMHDNHRHPIDQTLRGGTQTIGNLLDRKEPILVALREMFAGAVTELADGLPDSPFNPYKALRGGHFRFTGSWSVRLASEGFHLSHLHPAGRMSSCYYVSVPPEIAQGAEDEGCLVLGASPLDLGGADVPLATIRPQPGLLALFPSRMYHATVPFRSSSPRLTVAFDVGPA